MRDKQGEEGRTQGSGQEKANVSVGRLEFVTLSISCSIPMLQLVPPLRRETG